MNSESENEIRNLKSQQQQQQIPFHSIENFDFSPTEMDLVDEINTTGIYTEGERGKKRDKASAQCANTWKLPHILPIVASLP